MGIIDQSMQNLASTLTGILGTDVDVEITQPGSYNPATREASGGVDTVTVNGVLGSYHETEFGDQIKRSDVRVYIPGKDIERPRNGDHITVDGSRMRVISSKLEYAGGLTALYECQVRA